MKGKKKKPKVEIHTFIINRSMGESYDWKNLGFDKKHVAALNEIGYSGKFKGKPMTIGEYFKKKVDDGCHYTIKMWTSNNMEFTDKLLVTQVKVK